MDMFINELKSAKLPDIATYLGLLVSIIGFIYTIWTVRQSKSAAVRAETAALATQRKLRTFDTISELSDARVRLEAIIKDLDSEKLDTAEKSLMLYRQSILEVMINNDSLSGLDSSPIMNGLDILGSIQIRIGRSISKGTKFKALNARRELVAEIDNVTKLLVQLKSKM